MERVIEEEVDNDVHEDMCDGFVPKYRHGMNKVLGVCKVMEALVYTSAFSQHFPSFVLVSVVFVFSCWGLREEQGGDF